MITKQEIIDKIAMIENRFINLCDIRCGIVSIKEIVTFIK